MRNEPESKREPRLYDALDFTQIRIRDSPGASPDPRAALAPTAGTTVISWLATPASPNTAA